MEINVYIKKNAMLPQLLLENRLKTRSVQIASVILPDFNYLLESQCIGGTYISCINEFWDESKYY